jgi:hypothetical protein
MECKWPFKQAEPRFLALMSVLYGEDDTAECSIVRTLRLTLFPGCDRRPTSSPEDDLDMGMIRSLMRDRLYLYELPTRTVVTTAASASNRIACHMV